LIQNLAAPAWDWNVVWPTALIVIGVAIFVLPLLSGEPLHYGRSFWAATFILVGGLVLLGNAGWIAVRWGRIGDLWPLILVVIGAEILITRALPGRTAAPLGALVAIAAILLGALYLGVAAGTVGTAGAVSSQASAPLGTVSAGHLELNVGGASVTVRGDAGTNQLYSAAFTNRSGDSTTAVVDRPTGTVRIELRNRPFDFSPSGGRTVTVNLSSRIPWSININGGATTVTIDVSGLSLSRLAVNGGATTLRLTVGAPNGTVPISVNGGANTVTIDRPAGTEASVTMSGGVNDFTADGQHQSALGGNITWQSPGYAAAADRYDVHAAGGANHLILEVK
jgi:hypothetical protein